MKNDEKWDEKLNHLFVFGLAMLFSYCFMPNCWISLLADAYCLGQTTAIPPRLTKALPLKRRHDFGKLQNHLLPDWSSVKYVMTTYVTPLPKNKQELHTLPVAERIFFEL